MRVSAQRVGDAVGARQCVGVLPGGARPAFDAHCLRCHADGQVTRGEGVWAQLVAQRLAKAKAR